MNSAQKDEPSTVTIVVQTRVRIGKEADFETEQARFNEAVTRFPGFVAREMIPPSPPAQADWVILERFAGEAAALAWLHSSERLALVQGIAPLLIGRDDVHLVRDGSEGVLPAPISAVISTRIKPGSEDEYRRWEQRIAVAQSRSIGFQGYRFEPPVPGVQEDWLAILRFDTEEHLQAWMDSPERKKLLVEAEAFTENFHARIVRTGFEQWFAQRKQGDRPPVWKQNMVVLLLLYPVVFLFGIWVQNPLLIARWGMPFWLAMFVGNVVSILLLNWLVPWTSRALGWWISPPPNRRRAVDLSGGALLVLLYCATLFVFSRM